MENTLNNSTISEIQRICLDIDGGRSAENTQSCEDQGQLLVAASTEKELHCTFALVDLFPGQLLVIEDVFLWVPTAQHSFLICHHCKGRVSIGEPTLKCEECGIPIYCSERCQHDAQTLHALECHLVAHVPHALRDKKSLSGSQLGLLLKVRAKRKLLQNLSTENNQYKTEVDALSVFQKLVFEEELFSTVWKEECELAIQSLTEWDTHQILGNTKDCTSDLFRIKAHLHEVEVPFSQDSKVLITAVFPRLSCFQHSCSPNCYYWTNNGKMEVRSIQQVRSGVPLSVSYTAIYAPRFQRRSSLLESNHIFCNCTRCQTWESEEIIDGFVCDGCEKHIIKGEVGNDLDTTTSIRANNELAVPSDETKQTQEHKKNEGTADALCGISIEDTEGNNEELCEYVPCPFCGFENNYSDVLATKKELETYSQFDQGVLLLLQNPFVQDQVNDILEISESILHPHNYLIFRSRQVLYQACLDSGNIEGCIQHCKKIIKCLSCSVMPKYSVEAASYLMILGFLFLKLAGYCSQGHDGYSQEQRNGYINQAYQAFKDAKLHQDICTGEGSVIQKLEQINKRIDNIQPP